MNKCSKQYYEKIKKDLFLAKSINGTVYDEDGYRIVFAFINNYAKSNSDKKLTKKKNMK